MTTFDQVNVSEISGFELLLRSAQLAGLRHKQQLIMRTGDDVHGDDEHLFLGIGETRGLCMISPDLENYVATGMAKESSVLEERRKLRGEREMLKPKPKHQPNNKETHGSDEFQQTCQHTKKR